MKKFLKRSLLALVIILAMIAAVGLVVNAAETTEVEGVAYIQNGSTKTYYKTLSEAVGAAQDGDTVVVYKNIDDSAAASATASATVSGKSITVKSEGSNVFTVTTKGGNPLFDMKGGAALTIEKINFNLYNDSAAENFIRLGHGESGSNSYQITLKDVDCSFGASGAIYPYYVNNVNIVAKDCNFTGARASGDGVLNTGGTIYGVLNMALVDSERLSDCALENTSATVNAVEITSVASTAETANFRIDDAVVGSKYFDSLQTAVNACADGDTILVCKGTEASPLVISSSISVHGKKVTIKSSDSTKRFINITGTSVGVVFALNKDAGLVLENLSIDAYGVNSETKARNLVHFGAGATTPADAPRYSYELTMNNVDVSFNAGGAINAYNIANATLNIHNCTFNGEGTTDNRAVLNFSGGYTVTGKMDAFYSNLTFTGKCTKFQGSIPANVECRELLDKGQYFSSVSSAQTGGMKAMLNNSNGAAGYENETFFATIKEALAAAKEGDTIYVIGDLTTDIQTPITKNITLKGYNSTKYSVKPTATGAIFRITNGADVTFEDLNFSGCDNFIMYGVDGADYNEYVLDFKNINCDFKASGAIYGYKAARVTINIDNAYFKGANLSGHNILRTGRAVENAVTLNMTGVNYESCGILYSSGEGNLVHIITNSTNNYGNDSEAINAGMQARIGTVTAGKEGVVYFKTLNDAIKTAKDGETVYVLQNIASFSDATIYGKSIIVKSADAGKYTITAASSGKFDLRRGAGLTLENLKFTSYSGKNLIFVGNGEFSARKAYTVNLKNVELSTFKAGGAINLYNASNVVINIEDCAFDAEASGNAIVNYGGTWGTDAKIDACTLTVTNTKLNSLCSVVNSGVTGNTQKNAVITIDRRFTSETKATECGVDVVAKIGTYYYGLKDAIAATPNGGTVYIIKNIADVGTVEIVGKTLTIEGTSQFEISTTAGKAFNLTGGANVTIKNLKFKGFTGKNVVTFGGVNTRDYNITFENVEFNFRATGAIYGYVCKDVTITFTNCTFNADQKGDAAVAFTNATAVSGTGKIISKNIVLNGNANVLYSKTNKVSCEDYFTSDAAALAAKIPVVRDNNGNYIPLRIGAAGASDTIYYRSIADYLKAKLGADNDKIVDNTYTVVYTPDAFVSEILDTTGIKIGDDQFIQAGHDYYGAWRIALALYGTKTDNANLPNGNIYAYGNENIAAAKRVYVGLVNDKAYDLVKNLAVNEYAIYVDDNGDIYLLGWNDKALNAAIDAFIGTIMNNTATLPVGTHKFVVSTEWAIEFTKPTLESACNLQYVNDNSVQYVYYGTATEYEAYIAALEDAEYAVKWSSETGKNKFAILQKGDVVLYVAYNDFTYKSLVTANDTYRTNFNSCIRVVAMPAGSITTPDEMTEITTANPTYTKVTNSFITTVGMANPGASYIVALEDGRFIVVDGGVGYTGSALWAALVKAYEKAYNTTYTEGTKITIAAWYLTHAHSDHYSEFDYLIKEYGDDINLQYIIANGIDNSSIALYEAGQTGKLSSDGTFISGMVEATGCKFIKAHTGQKFYFANVELEVLMTFEDHAPVAITNSNDTNTIIRMNIKTGDNVSSVLFLGDSHINAGRYLVAMYGSYLESDMVTLAHHGNVGVEDLVYKLVAAKAVFVPHISTDFGDSDYRLLANKTAKDIAQYLWFAGASEGEGGIINKVTTLVTYTLDFTANGPDYANFGATNYASAHDEHNVTVSDQGTLHYGECSCGAILGVGEHADIAVKDHACDACGKTGMGDAHEAAEGKHTCDYCGGTVSNCVDADPKNHECDVCGTAMGDAHKAAEGKHTCDYCGETVSNCVDADPKDHACDVCGTAMGDAHEAAEGKHTCDYCGETVSNCVDADPKDHECDVCGTAMGTHAPADENTHDCDYCGKRAGDCVDADENGICDICGVANHECVDTDKNHECDICEKAMGGEHKATAGTHVCAYCNVAVSECADENKDHKCDICGEAKGDEHKAADGSHNCAYCGKTASECADADKNGKCDVCGEDVAHVCTGGTATCTKKAVCTICSKEYGTFGDHNYGTLVPAVPEVHTQTELVAGMAAYYHCDECDTYFNEAKDESSLAALKGEVPAHKFNAWSTDAENHWKQCSCGLVTEMGAHNFSGIFCEDCRYSAVVHVHINVKRIKGQSATANAAGWKDYYQCDCGTYFADAACTIEIEDIETWKNGDGKLIPLSEVVFTPDEFAGEVQDIISNIVNADSPLVVVKQTTRFVTAIIGLLTSIFG